MVERSVGPADGVQRKCTVEAKEAKDEKEQKRRDETKGEGRDGEPETTRPELAAVSNCSNAHKQGNNLA